MTPSSHPRVDVLPTEEVATAAAAQVAAVLADAVAARGIAHWATTGGSAAPGIYDALATSPLREQVPWDLAHTWWGDDRFVPYDHPDSNVRPLHQHLLGPAGIDTGQTSWAQEPERYARFGIRVPAGNLHPWPIPQAIARANGPAWAAAAYAATLEAELPTDAAGTPVLDLVLLGVGPDGHILSVFPGSEVWDEPGSCAAVPAPSHIGPHLDRVTLHPRLVAAARSVLVVTSGGSKAENVARAWDGDNLRELPLRAARLASATWILDEAAASRLSAR